MEELDSVFGAEEAQVTEPTPAEEQANVAPEGTADEQLARDDEAEEQKMVPLAALKEERGKRQERDREIERMQQQIAHFQQLAAAYGQAQAGVQAAPQAQEDPYAEDTVYADLPKALRTVEERTMSRIEADRRAERYENSEILARHLHDDYEPMVRHFAEMAHKNPMLAEQMERHRSPALFAYEAAKRDLDLQTSVQKQIEEALERERAKLAAKSAPASIAYERGTGQTAGAAHFEQPSLKEILGR